MHLGGGDYLWPQWDSSLTNVIWTKITKQPDDVKDWVVSLVGRDVNAKSLLYRHYLLSAVIDVDIQPHVQFPQLYLLMASSLIQPVTFSPVPALEIWQGIENDPEPINLFRHRHPLIRDVLCDLSMQDHIHHDQLQDHHGVLFSLSLLYGLYLVYVVLVYEAKVKSSPILCDVITNLRDTLLQLKGAFLPWDVSPARS